MIKIPGIFSGCGVCGVRLRGCRVMSRVICCGGVVAARDGSVPLAFTCRFAEKSGKFRGNGQPKTWKFPGIFGILGRRVSPKIPGIFGVLVIVAFRNFPEISTKRRNDERRGEMMNEEEK